MYIRDCRMLKSKETEALQTHCRPQEVGEDCKSRRKQVTARKCLLDKADLLHVCTYSCRDQMHKACARPSQNKCQRTGGVRNTIPPWTYPSSGRIGVVFPNRIVLDYSVVEDHKFQKCWPSQIGLERLKIETKHKTLS